MFLLLDQLARNWSRDALSPDCSLNDRLPWCRSLHKLLRAARLLFHVSCRARIINSYTASPCKAPCRPLEYLSTSGCNGHQVRGLCSGRDTRSGHVRLVLPGTRRRTPFFVLRVWIRIYIVAIGRIHALFR